MVLYRRNYVKGGTYFFTVTLADRRMTTLTTHIGLLGDAFRKTRDTMPFKTVAHVILPEHMHVIWTLPHNDHVFSKRWRAIKARFTNVLISNQHVTRKTPVWQSRFWERVARGSEARPGN